MKAPNSVVSARNHADVRDRRAFGHRRHGTDVKHDTRHGSAIECLLMRRNNQLVEQWPIAAKLKEPAPGWDGEASWPRQGTPSHLWP
jgi:hypothetical protein